MVHLLNQTLYRTVLKLDESSETCWKTLSQNYYFSLNYSISSHMTYLYIFLILSILYIFQQYLQSFNTKYDTNGKPFLFLLLRKLNLCSTGVNLKPLTRLLKACHTLEHLNLAGCRSLPRPMKKCYTNREAIVQLKNDI